jgi:hypothetical protein
MDSEQEVQPRNVLAAPLFVCSSRRSQSSTTIWLTCSACGWSGQQQPQRQPADGEAEGLFSVADLPAPPDPHPVEECRRRQLDPQYRYDQDKARLAAAGITGVLASPKP